jgi:hypothetical protein
MSLWDESNWMKMGIGQNETSTGQSCGINLVVKKPGKFRQNDTWWPKIEFQAIEEVQ